MGEISHIAWTDATFNPWWGCTRVSPGCEHCYAETLATVRRKLPVWGVDAERKPMSEAYWREPAKWNRKAEKAGVRMRVFCASMADVFELAPARNVQALEVQGAARQRLWKLIEETPWLDWLLLTKRPQNIGLLTRWERWPANVWLGVTAEDQKRYDERWPIAARIPAAVHFISHEPALEPIELKEARVDDVGMHWRSPDWVITGGESGSKARPYDPEWARSIIRQCRAIGAAPFVKQLGSRPHTGAIPYRTIDPKGGDPSEWAGDIRVREFPEVA